MASEARAATSKEANCVLFLCFCYYARYPSETMWQRLRALSRLAEVALLPVRGFPYETLPPPDGVKLTQPPRTRERFPLRRYTARVVDQARELARQGKRGLIWTRPGPFAARAAFAAARATDWPVAIDVWDVPDLSMRTQLRERRLLKSFAHWMLQWGLSSRFRRADLVVWSLHPDAMRRYFSPEPHKILCLPNGLQWGELQRLRNKIVRQVPVPSGPTLRLLYVGFFQKSRGSDVLIAIMSRLRNRPNVHLDVVGPTSSPEVSKAVKAAEKAGLKNITFQGRTPWEKAMAMVYQADVCLHPFPALPELEMIYPLKVLEYAAFGKRILCSDVPGARSVLKDYPRAKFIDADRPDEWTAAIQAFTESLPPQREKERTPDLAWLAAYDWDRLGNRLLGRVRKLLAERQPTPHGRRGDQELV